VSVAPPPVLAVEGLEVVHEGRALLAPSSFRLHEGERVLLVGPSGAGKSLFLDVLLGFVGPDTPGIELRGSVLLDGEELLGRGPEARDGRVGAVFQVHRLGLFDDLDVEQNLRFGSRDGAEAARMADSLGLAERGRPAAVCSGGERLRVAMARTLLRGADVLVFDEPTAGLDPASVRQVVEAIRSHHRRLTLVVTHERDAFEGLADAVVEIDPGTRTLRRLPAPVPVVADRPSPRPRGPLRRALSAWDRAAVAAAVGAADLLAVLRWPEALLRVAHPLDGPRVRRELARDLAPGVAAFVATSAVLVSLTATYFLFDRLPRREYAEPLVQEGLLAGLGQILTRVVIPLIATILLAAKLGASSAANLGQMSLTRQVDALRLLRVPLRRHLLLPTAAAQILATWVHVGLALLLSFATTAAVFLWTHPGWSWAYVRWAYARELAPSDVLWLLAKCGACALAVSAVAWRVGAAPKRAPEEVVRGIHRTLLRALLLVLAIHAAFAFAEF
jgi:energy-coupling factor transporter ATP-binding protein EcfA2